MVFSVSVSWSIQLYLISHLCLFPHSLYTPCFFPILFLQREYDENEVDPYHGQQEKQPEVEPLDLPDNLNLEDDEKSDGEKEGEGIAENL